MSVLSWKRAMPECGDEWMNIGCYWREARGRDIEIDGVGIYEQMDEWSRTSFL